MGELPEDLRRTTDLLTRLAVACEGLGIDPAPLQARLPELGTAPGRYARVSLDSDRIAVRCPGGVFARPGDDPLLEFETIPGEATIAELVLVHGRRAFAEDLPLLVAGGVAPGVVSELATRLGTLGDGRCDALGRRTELGTLHWIASIAYERADVGASPTLELATMAARLAQIGGALGIADHERRLIEQAHVVLAADQGFTLTITCAPERVLPELEIEYREVPWSRVVGLSDAFAPGSRSGPRLGVFAGAFDAARASTFAITLRTGRPARLRTSIEPAEHAS